MPPSWMLPNCCSSIVSDDYFMRQISGIADLLSHLVFGKQNGKEDVFHQIPMAAEDRTLITTLRFLLNIGQINEAENLLFETLEHRLSAGLPEVVDTFYRWLSELDDQALIRGGFSREEITQGHGDAVALLGKNRGRQSAHAHGLLPDEEEKAKEK